MVLVDTSVWVDFLRGRSGSHVEFLERLLEEGEAHLCEVVFAEICFGARDKHQFRKYREYFAALPFFPLPKDWHGRIAEMGFELRGKGLQPFISDLLIALAAIHNRALLLTRDSDFKPMESLFGLRFA